MGEGGGGGGLEHGYCHRMVQKIEILSPVRKATYGFRKCCILEKDVNFQKKFFHIFVQ